MFSLSPLYVFTCMQCISYALQIYVVFYSVGMQQIWESNFSRNQVLREVDVVDV